MLANIAFSLVLLHIATAAEFGTCSAIETTDFIGALPAGDTCYSSFVAVLHPENVTQEYEDALAFFCTTDCGEAIAKFIAVACEDPATAVGLLLYCLPRNTETGRCRSVFPDLIDQDVVQSLGSCLGFDGTVCPVGCADALWQGVNQIGCCFQNVYNETAVVSGLAAKGLLTANDVEVIEAVTNQALWWACNHTLITECTGDPFPGDSVLAAGICNFVQVSTYVATNTPSTCSGNYSTLFNDTAMVSVLEGAYDEICQPDCGGKVATYLYETCLDPFSKIFTGLNCHRTNGDIGNRCAFALGPQINTTFYNIGKMCFGDTADCSTGCSNALEGLKDQIGCCYQNIYNNTEILDLLLINYDINFEQRYFLGALGTQAVWDDCGVTLQPECTGDPFSAGALKLAASFMTVMSVIILPMIV